LREKSKWGGKKATPINEKRVKLKSLLDGPDFKNKKRLREGGGWARRLPP